MKKIKNKYIRITENELRSLIEQEINKAIPLLLEYAIPRHKFVDNVYNLLEQICQNWCLIRYSKLINDNNTNVPHWKSELKSYLRNVSRTKIKKNNSTSSRMSAIAQSFDWSDLDKSDKQVHKYIERKFNDEGYKTEMTEPYVTVCFDFKNEVKTLMILMANSNDNDIDEYVNSL